MFQISTKGRYATRILYRMALFGPDQPIRKVDIAEAEGLTPDYVEQIMTRLYAAGLVKSHRGPKGGFTIGKNPDEITVAEVLDATEGPIAIAPCIEGECARKSKCVVRSVWEKASDALTEIFSTTTIGELARQSVEFKLMDPASFDI